MTTAAKPITEIAAEWRAARKLYIIYSALLERFALGLPPCRELESPIDRNEPQAIQRIEEWLTQMDERVHVHQLRQLLQTSKLGTEDQLHALISHHLEKEKKTESDRDKVDFLLVQYLSSCAPPGFYDRNVEFEEIARVLEPILGEVGLHAPQWMEPLDDAIRGLDHFHGLRDLLSEGMLEQMRKLKSNAGEMYFGPTALVAITRFNFLVRRAFVRLIAADLHSIRVSLHELEQRGVVTVDCSRANLSDHETLEALKQICQEWKKPFRAAYAAGQNFKELIEIRAAVEEALAHASEEKMASEPAIQNMAYASNGAPISTTETENTSSINEFSFDDISEPASYPNMLMEPHPASSIPLEFKAEGEPAAVIKIARIERREEAPAEENFASKSEHVPEQKAASVAASKAASEESASDFSASHSAPIQTPPSGTLAAQLDIQVHQEQIAQQLTSNHVKVGSIANLALGPIKLMLSSWEVEAYVEGGTESSGVLQRAVAARVILAEQLEKRKRGDDAPQLHPAMKLAHLESAKIQARIAIARESKDIDSAVNLAATSKRLSQLIEEAGKFSK